MSVLNKAYEKIFKAYLVEKDPEKKKRLDNALDTIANFELLRPNVNL